MRDSGDLAFDMLFAEPSSALQVPRCHYIFYRPSVLTKPSILQQKTLTYETETDNG